MYIVMYKARAIRGRRRGVTALLSMLFLVLITVLSLAMFHVAAANVQTSHNFSDLARAQAAAESGLRGMGFRFQTMHRHRIRKSRSCASYPRGRKGRSGAVPSVMAR